MTLPAAWKRDFGIALILFLIAVALLTVLKDTRTDEFQGDTALFFQITDNIAHRGLPVSQVGATVVDAVSNGMLGRQPSAVASAPLVPASAGEYNEFRTHTYLILYPIAMLTYVLPVDFTLMLFDALSFAGIILIAYVAARARGISIVAAALFCILVMVHPIWIDGLTGQFYPDRLFMPAGLACMLLVSARGTRKRWLLLSALLCMAINERAAVTIGLFILAYVVLYWRAVEQRAFRLGLAVAALVYGVLAMKLVTVGSGYSHYLPDSVSQLVRRFEDPTFALDTLIFLAVNATLLVLSLFDWRATLIAFALMLPNILGDIGGAEKTGWYTHYHALYFPALVWAALAGWTALWRMSAAAKRTVLAYAAGAILVLFSAGVAPATGTFSLAAIAANPLRTLPQDVANALGPDGMVARAIKSDLPNAVPEGSTVSTIESGMPYLYHDRTIEFYPIDIDRADYVVVGSTKTATGYTYSGAVNFNGPAATAELNRLLTDRMRRDGYDVSHPTIVDNGNVAVIRRIH